MVAVAALVFALGGGNALADQGGNSEDPGRLAVYVHYDYMVAANGTSDAPDPAATDIVKRAFRARGIDLVIDPRHTAIPMYQLIAFDEGRNETDTSCVPVDQWVPFSILKAQYFQPREDRPWHYAIFGERIDCRGFVSGIATINGDDFVIGLGQLRDAFALFPPPRDVLLRLFAGTFMHELGHNLGLRHGGDSNLIGKPNYLSVMNANFTFSGIPFAAALGSTDPIGYRIDYSAKALPTLDEQHLDERLGIQSGTTDISSFVNDFGIGFGSVPGVGPADWNLDGDTTDRDIAVSLHELDPRYPVFGKLTGFDDWTFVRGVLLGTITPGPPEVEHQHEQPAHPPVVLSIGPASGPAFGGTAVTIHGTALDKVDRVLFGLTPAASFHVVNNRTVVAVAPPGSGTVHVSAGSGPSLSVWGAADRFTFLTPVISLVEPRYGPGGMITIRGDRLGTARSVWFRSGFPGDPSDHPARGFTVIDDHTILADVPPCDSSGNPCGGGHVVVTTDAYGANPITYRCCSLAFFADFYFYTLQPRFVTITSIDPPSGHSSNLLDPDGTLVTIKGTGFRLIDSNGVSQGVVIWVTFGGVGSTNIAVSSADTVTARPPAGSGTVDLQLWTWSGPTAPSAAARFTYTGP